MAISAVKVWVPAEVLYAADLNAERDNILNNALALVSPWTGNMDANTNDLIGLDETAYTDAAANATATGRLRRNSTNLTWHDGTVAGRLFYAGGTDVPVADGGTGLSSGTSGGIPYFSATTTVASSALLTQYGLMYGGGAGATPVALGAMTNGQVVIGSTGAAPVVASLTAGSGITITPAAGAITIAETTASPSAATQAEMEAASSTTVYDSPGRAHFHPGVAKAWVNFEANGTINSSRNVTSITVTAGDGDWDVNLTTGFSSTANLALFGSALNAADANTTHDIVSASVFSLFCFNQAGTLLDPTRLFALAFGDFT